MVYCVINFTADRNGTGGAFTISSGATLKLEALPIFLITIQQFNIASVQLNTMAQLHKQLSSNLRQSTFSNGPILAKRWQEQLQWAAICLLQWCNLCCKRQCFDSTRQLDK